ncbi:MAG: hypothetical protein ABII12_17690 [Planctomycetota bacterium]
MKENVAASGRGHGTIGGDGQSFKRQRGVFEDIRPVSESTRLRSGLGLGDRREEEVACARGR